MLGKRQDVALYHNAVGWLFYSEVVGLFDFDDKVKMISDGR